MNQYRLTIRRANANDAGIMAEIHRRSWSAAYAGLLSEETIERKNATREALWKHLLQADSGSAYYYLAEVNGKTAGFVSFGHCRDENIPGTGEIQGLYLLPEFFRCRIGSSLISFAVNELKKMGFARVSLWVLSTNCRAIRCYESNGFVKDGEKQDFIGEPVVELRYSRILD